MKTQGKQRARGTPTGARRAQAQASARRKAPAGATQRRARNGTPLRQDFARATTQPGPSTTTRRSGNDPHRPEDPHNPRPRHPQERRRPEPPRGHQRRTKAKPRGGGAQQGGATSGAAGQTTQNLNVTNPGAHTPLRQVFSEQCRDSLT